MSIKKNKNNKKNSNPKAFTLIELMVSLSILVLVILAAMAIYLRVIGTREKTVGQLNIQEDGQFVMTVIAKDIRANQIDYDNYGGYCDPIVDSNTAVEQLCLKNISETEEIIYKTAIQGDIGVIQRCQSANCTDEDFSTISMSKLEVQRFDVYIKPASEPFTAGSIEYTHPRATVVLKLKSLLEKDPPSPLVLQQTVPQRYGFRK